MEIKIFSKEEQETTIVFMRGDKLIQIYTSDTTVITKLKKITDSIEVLTVDSKGRPTSIKAFLNPKQLSFRKYLN